MTHDKYKDWDLAQYTRTNFLQIFAQIPHYETFDALWSDCSFKDKPPQTLTNMLNKVVLPPYSCIKTIDQFNRKVVLVSTPLGNVVVYETRYINPKYQPWENNDKNFRYWTLSYQASEELVAAKLVPYVLDEHRYQALILLPYEEYPDFNGNEHFMATHYVDPIRSSFGFTVQRYLEKKNRRFTDKAKESAI